MRTVSLIITLLLMAFNAQAADGAWESAERIRTTAGEFVARQSASGAQVQVGALDERLRLPACDQPLQAMTSGNANRGAMSVAVRCDGASAWTLYVPVRVSQRQPVLVLTRPLARGNLITAEAIELQEQDISSLPYGYMTGMEQAIGKILKRSLSQGNVLTPDAIESPRAIRRGQVVTVLGVSGLIEVRASGKALSDAADGERVKVENSNSRRVVEGVARSSGVVEVNL